MEMRFFVCFLPRKADGITFVSEETEKDLRELCNINDKVIEIAPTSIDIDTFKPVKTNLRKELCIRDNEKIILFVGALIPRKGIDILVESWKELRKNKDYHLIIIGQGPLRKLVPKERRVHHISYAGSKNRLVEFYNIADVFAFPTRLEGFGMVVGEAMACGTPVVTTNAKGVRKIVDERTGFRINIDDIKSFTEKIELLLGNEKLRKRMGKNSIKRIRENFTWDRTVSNTERFLERLIKNA